MIKNPFSPSFDLLPRHLPVFPLTGALLLPLGRLPLNIFETTYLQMIQDALAAGRIIGMIQERQGPVGSSEMYRVGCAGKITEFEETPDGRFLIALTGLCRFSVVSEIPTNKPYRVVEADWSGFKDDLEHKTCLNIDRDRLNHLLGEYFKTRGLTCDWEKIGDASDGQLITCLSMVCPFDPSEKQALLEAVCCETRGAMFITMLEMAVHQSPEETQHHKH